MTERLTGFNLILSKTGEKRTTKYFAQKDEIYPMPEEFYTPAKLFDPFELAQSLMYTDEYMDAIIGNYLYGEELPERSEDSYAYPELREKFKTLLTEDEVPEETAPRQRPGRAAAPAAEVKLPESTPETPVATGRSRRAAATSEPVLTGRPGRAAAPAGRGRPTRNLSEDLKNVE
jgi:hypothetical protein